MTKQTAPKSWNEMTRDEQREHNERERAEFHRMVAREDARRHAADMEGGDW